VLEFSCYWTCPVDVLVVAVEKAAKEIRWLVHSCSNKNSNSRCSNSDTVSVATAFKNSSTEATSCRALVLLDTVSKACGLLWDAFYDTISILNGPETRPIAKTILFLRMERGNNYRPELLFSGIWATAVGHNSLSSGVRLSIGR